MDRDKLLSLAVAREQSFTRAAAKPGVPQSAAGLKSAEERATHFRPAFFVLRGRGRGR